MPEGDERTSECPYGAYYPAAEGSLPAAVGKQAEPGQLPVAVLGVVREDPPRGVAGRSAREVQDAVVVLGHCPLIVRERTGCASHPGNSRRRRETVAGNSMGGLSGFRGNGLRGRDGHFVAAPRMVLAAVVALGRGGEPVRA
jgi:hypothetical protein